MKSALPNPKDFLHCLKSPEMTSQKQFLAEISSIYIFHTTQYFWAKSYKRNQRNLPNILEYISGILEDLFQGGSVPLSRSGFDQAEQAISAVPNVIETPVHIVKNKIRTSLLRL